MAARARRYRRTRLPSSTAAPTSLQFIPSIAGQASEWNATVQLATDRKALENLAAGHTQWFIDFATERVKDATSDRDKQYWNSLLDDTRQHIEDDTLAAQVKDGTKSLEDVLAHIKTRMAAVGDQSGDFPALLQQYSDVKNGIMARDFNSEIYAAHQKVIETQDHQAYIDTLKKLEARALDPQAGAALQEQIQTLQKLLDTEQINKRNSLAQTKVIDYLQGKVSRTEILPILGDLAAQASTPEEANRYVALATQIDTRERTLERQGAADAASAGTLALQNALDPVKKSYEDADAHFKVAFRTGNADRQVYKDLTTESEHYLATLKDALPNAANRTVRNNIVNDIQAVEANVGERHKQMAELITRDVTAEIGDYNSQAQIAAKKNTPEGDDLATQMRYLAVQSAQLALGDSVIKSMGSSDPSSIALQKLVRETTEAHQADIEKQSQIAAGMTGDLYGPAVSAAFKKYETYATTSANDKAISKGRSLTEDEFVTAMEEAGKLPEADRPAALATALHLNPANKTVQDQIATMRVALKNAYAKQQAKVDEATARLNVLVAPRDVKTGRAVKDAGPIQGLTDVTDYLRTFDKAPRIYASDPAGIPPQEQNTYAAAGLIPLGKPAPEGRPAGGLAALTSGLAEEYGMGDPYTAAEERAFRFLETPGYTLDLPNYDILPTPEIPAFSAKGTSLENLFSMPDAPLASKRGTGAGNIDAGGTAPTIAA